MDERGARAGAAWWRRTLVALVVVLCFGSVLAPASATTRIQADPPFEFWGRVYGTNARNNVCNALACEDRTYLERSSWQGYRKFDSSQRWNSTYTGPGCLNGTYDWKTAHRARYIVDHGGQVGITVGPIGVNVGSNGPQWSQEFSNWSSSRRLTTRNC